MCAITRPQKNSIYELDITGYTAEGLTCAFSDQYEGDTDNAVIFTLGTTILSVTTISVLCWVLRLIV